MAVPANGFAQKVLIILLGGLSTALLGFFVWLAVAVIEIRVGVAEMKANVESLMQTRRDQTNDQRQNTGARLNELERTRP